jgi:hypothetical protein
MTLLLTLLSRAGGAGQQLVILPLEPGSWDQTLPLPSYQLGKSLTCLA